MSKTILSVQGMSCPSCIEHVNEALTMQGVAKIAVQLDRGLVVVEHDAGVSVDWLIGALQSAGFEATQRSPS